MGRMDCLRRELREFREATVDGVAHVRVLGQLWVGMVCLVVVGVDAAHGYVVRAVVFAAVIAALMTLRVVYLAAARYAAGRVDEARGVDG